MTHSIPVEWWRRQAVASEAPIADGVGVEPRGGEAAYWALVAFTVVLIVVPQQYLPFLSAIRINLLIGAFAIAAHLFAPPKSTAQRFPLELKLALALVVCAAVSIPGSYWRSASLQVFGDFLRVLAVFWLLGQNACSVRRLRVFCWTLVLTCLPLALAALQNYQLGIGDGRVAGYSNNLAENPNDLALSLNLFLPLAAVLAVTTKSRVARLLGWGIILVSIAAVVVTFSRGGFLTLLVEATLFAWLMLRKHGGRVLLVAMVVGALGLTLVPAGYSERISTIVDIQADETGSAQMRWSDTVAATQFMLAHPIVGAGLGQGVLALNEVRGAYWTVVHNAYLNYGVDLGLVGFLLFTAMVLIAFRSARRIERLATVPAELRWMASGVRISLAGFIVAGAFHPIGYDFYFFYLAGLAVALKATAARQFGVQDPA